MDTLTGRETENRRRIGTKLMVNPLVRLRTDTLNGRETERHRSHSGNQINGRTISMRLRIDTLTGRETENRHRSRTKLMVNPLREIENRHPEWRETERHRSHSITKLMVKP